MTVLTSLHRRPTLPTHGDPSAQGLARPRKYVGHSQALQKAHRALSRAKGWIARARTKARPQGLKLRFAEMRSSSVCAEKDAPRRPEAGQGWPGPVRAGQGGPAQSRAWSFCDASRWEPVGAWAEHSCSLHSPRLHSRPPCIPGPCIIGPHAFLAPSIPGLSNPEPSNRRRARPSTSRGRGPGLCSTRKFKRLRAAAGLSRPPRR